MNVKKLNLLPRSSASLDKFLKSQKNLSKPPPKLFPHDDPPILPSAATYTPNDSTPVGVNLHHHQVLQKLERSCSHTRHFYQIHSQLIALGLFQDPLVAGRCIKKLCTSLNSVSLCVSLYDRVDEPDAFMCNTVMKSFLNGKDPTSALRFYYERMVAKGVLPNHYTFPIVAKVCAQVGSVREGERAHGRVVKFGFASDIYVRNSFITMYSASGKIWDARQLFDDGSLLDLVSWNAMINGYVKNGEVVLARELFDEMFERDVFSWNSMISGYVGVGDMESASDFFYKMPSRDIVSWNSMIDGYARKGDVLMARVFFNQMPARNIISWNIMLALYQRRKDYGECLKLFDMMVEKGVKPNQASLVSVLTACANFRRIDTGKWVHSYCKDNGIEADVLLSTALFTMYAKCGEMDMAKDIFDKMQDRSVVSWNSMIMGYAMHGHGEKALEMFLEMEKRGPGPNDATFVSVFHACSQARMVLEGWWYFHLMHKKYNIKPMEEHYGCMLDLLVRAGFIELSEEHNHLMAEATLQGTALPAYRTRTTSELGQAVAKKLIQLGAKDIAPYMLLSNLYAAEGKWDDVESVRKEMKEMEKREDFVPVENGSFHRRSMVHSMLYELGVQMRLYYMQSNGI